MEGIIYQGMLRQGADVIVRGCLEVCGKSNLLAEKGSIGKLLCCALKKACCASFLVGSLPQ